ncbi:AMP-binding protein [Ectothiorhodospiraceae bacterium WFHF3C12]|nr:AMP-binding protein [Ectothiorhodospiraceae bacterium WFHF3C12]
MTELGEQTLAKMLDGLPPEGLALIDGGSRWAYADLAAASRRVACGLVEAGVEAGDRVAIWLPNIPEWLVVYFACARVGAVAVALNTRFRSAEVEDIVGRSGCRVLVLWPGFKDIDFSGILAGVDADALKSVERVIVCRQDADAPSPLPGRPVHHYGTLDAAPPLQSERGGPDSPCTIFTTSGTTSAPKFVLHKQSVIVHHAREVVRGHGYDRPDAVLLQILPFCGAFGHAQAMAALAGARPLVLQTVFNAAEAMELGRSHRVTHFNCSDEMIARMLDADDTPRPLPDIHFVGCARFGGISGLGARAEERGVPLRGLFGMSECQALYALQPDGDPEERLLPGGLPVSPDGRVRAVDAGSGHTLPDGEIGALELTGPSLMMGYYGNEAATAEAITGDGYFRTGDLGYTTADGGFVFTGRAGDVLRLGGFLVAPAELEKYIQRHPAVRACAVVSGGGAHAGRAVAFVTTEPGMHTDESQLAAFCAEGLARFKVPARFHLLDELPTVPSPNGAKVRRNLLREWAESWS